MTEQILVVRADELRKYVDFQGFLPMSEAEVHRLYEDVDVIPLEREKAETDPTFKQLVAYTVVRSEGVYLTYLRGKGQGEARLRGNRSIGFGGHINSGDQATLFIDDHLKAAAFRELDEEIEIPNAVELRCVGLLNDDSNEVGQVHLGLIYLADLPDLDYRKREKSIARISEAKPEELKRDLEQFETWSRILIESIDKI